MDRDNLPHVLILGSGFAGLETAFSLRKHLSEDEVSITVLTDHPYFLFKPNTIYIPFGADPEQFQIDIQTPLRRKNIRLMLAQATDVLAADGEVRFRCRSGIEGTLEYDYLVLATGASMRPQEIEGLAEHALTIWTPQNMLGLRGAFKKIKDKAASGASQEVLFLVPPNNKCSGPLYEMVLMLNTHLRRLHLQDRVHVTWSTYEKGFIQAFGPRLHEVVRKQFERRQIEGYTEYAVQRVEEGRVLFSNGDALPYDLLVSFPPYVASTPYPTLPTDDRGFVKTVLETRQVVGHPDIYAVGDASDFPVKQAFLAFLQADAAAAHIISSIRRTEFSHPFDPISMCVMEQLDTATFAQVPLHQTGRVEQPVEVRQDAEDQYKVGSSPAWRLGKKLLGVYLPWRFRAGEPFHEGLAWNSMEAGLKVMSTVLAE